MGVLLCRGSCRAQPPVALSVEGAKAFRTTGFLSESC